MPIFVLEVEDQGAYIEGGRVYRLELGVLASSIIADHEFKNSYEALR